jgi:hypothetical protein
MILKLALKTDKAKKYLLFGVLFVALALFSIELSAFFEKAKFWTRVDKGKFMIFCNKFYNKIK